MPQPLAILGINAAHDASACLLINGQIVVAITEERLSRSKHQAGFPFRALEYCLRAAGIKSLDVLDCVVVNQPPSLNSDLELRRQGYTGNLITNPSHHLLHAYYAWVASGFRETAIIIVDGSGYSYGEYVRRSSPMLGAPPAYSEMEEAESLYVVRDNHIELFAKRWALWEGSSKFCRFASLGHMFSMASQYIFGHWNHAGKIMGLAPFGDPTAFPEPFVDLTGPEMIISTDWPFALPARSPAPAHLDPVCCNLAAKVQAELERAMLHLALRLHRETAQKRLCISGGVGLNSVTNGRILREMPYSELFVTPAANDGGVCVGAALYGYHRITQETPHWHYRNDYHGRRYPNAEVIDAAVQRVERLHVEQVKDSAARAAQDIADGLVIGWFEGGSELGPRALGHRSILCDPRTSAMRDRLNATVKFREPFRPYAASVLTEHVHEFFFMSGDDPFMLIVASVRPECRNSIAGVCHIDGTCRIQTVGVGHEGQFRNLIECFRDLTGLPLVLNTSFNIRGEPIVESPSDAMDCFLASNIDVLYVEEFRITKASVVTAARPGFLVPFLNNGLSINSAVSSINGRAKEPEHHVQTRTGYCAPITAIDLAFLRATDGRRTISAIGNALRDVVSADPVSVFTSLQWRGFVSFRLEHVGEDFG